MNTISRRRIGAIVGAAAITISITGSTAPASSAGQRDTTPDRPCFMVRSHWNNAEGPQPTCTVPMWQVDSSDTASRPGSGYPTRGLDYLP